MPNLTLDKLFAAIPGQWEKVIATALLIAVGLALTHLWSRYLARGEISAEKRRMHLVWARNIIWFVVALTIVTVWAATIAGFALSVAAVAAALLIVSKELVMCVLGYLYVTMVQPFKVGDVIEFQALRGRVIDIDMFATTLVEQDGAGQLTGKTAEFPNGLLLTIPSKNISSTGEYSLYLIRMPIPLGSGNDLDRIEAAALAAADQAAGEWRDQAMAHFRRISDESFIAYPSGRSKVTWDFSDPIQLMLVVRVACPSAERAKVEQAVFRDTWRAITRAQGAMPAADAATAVDRRCEGGRFNPADMTSNPRSNQR